MALPLNFNVYFFCAQFHIGSRYIGNILRGRLLLSSLNLQRDLIGFLVGVGCSLLLTRFVRAYAHRLGVVDQLNQRKIHTAVTPRVGGVALFASTIVAVVVATYMSAPIEVPTEVLTIFLGAAAMFGLGLWDDFSALSARAKLPAQIAIALAVAYGVRVSDVALPIVGIVHLTPWVAVGLTALWFVGVTNAFNLVDGLDGLAGGAAAFAALAVFLVGSWSGQTIVALSALALLGATLGFLRFNFNPATIFLGDSGSYFLGFVLAGLALLSARNTSFELRAAVPALILGLPVLETLLTMSRRFLRAQSILQPDRAHLHHRLLLAGSSQRRAVYVLYTASACLAFFGAYVAYPTSASAQNFYFPAVLFALSSASVVFLLGNVSVPEFQEAGRLLRSVLHGRRAIGRNVRIHEARCRLAALHTIPEILDSLSELFGDENFPVAELRLQQWFLNNYGSGNASTEACEFAVWSFTHPVSCADGDCEFVFPLMTENGKRIGALAIWERATTSSFGLSHLALVAGELRAELQRKLERLGWPNEETSSLRERSTLLVVGTSAAEAGPRVVLSKETAA